MTTDSAVSDAPRVVTAAPLQASRARPRAEKRSWDSSYRRALGVTDALVIIAATVATYLWRFGGDAGTQLDVGRVTYPVIAVAIAGWWWLTLHAAGSRDRGVLGHGLEEYRRVINASLLTFGAVAIASYFFEAQLSRGFFLGLLPIGVFGLLAGRWSLRQVLHRRRAKGGAFTPTVVAGAARDVREAIADLRRNVSAGYRPVAVALSSPDDHQAIQACPELAGLPVIDLESVASHVAAHRVRAVVVAPGLASSRVRRLAWELESSSARLMFVPSLLDVAGPRLAVHQMQDLSLVTVDLPRYSGWNHALKRAFDIVFSVVALVLLAPVMAVVALLIKREDGGPVLFRQQRVGRGGNPFIIHKFRTMSVDAESRIEALIAASGGRALFFKMEDDPRITKIGRVLRKYSLDELPQFWTSLRGGMSVVGPRPHVEREVAEYASETHRRLLIKPGITGLWQVNGRSKLSIEESIRLDLRYVENWSLTGDLAIILRTVRVVLHSSGAY